VLSRRANSACAGQNALHTTQLHPEAARCVRLLRDLDICVSMVTGDQKPTALNVARQVGGHCEVAFCQAQFANVTRRPGTLAMFTAVVVWH